MERPDNPRFPHHCTIIRADAHDPLNDESEEAVIYDGECRAYDKNTATDKGDVITSYRGLSLPVDREGWERRGVVPKEGDSVVVIRGGHKEYGRVIDKNAGNFRGTHLVWHYGR